MKLSLCPMWHFPETRICLEKVGLNSLQGIDSEQLAIQTCQNQVYSDVPYNASIIFEGEFKPSKIGLYLNGERVNCFGAFKEDRYIISFQNYETPRGDVFRDCYGYIKIEIECSDVDNPEAVTYTTPYIVVMLRATDTNQAIQRMAEYVYRQHNRFQWKKHTLPLGKVNLIAQQEKSLDTLMAILQNVVRIYEQNIAFFRANPQTKAETMYCVDDFAKLQNITPNTLQYIAQHPNELLATELESGICYNGQNYLPVHTLVANKKRVRETYENEAVLGFIHEVAIQCRDLVGRIEEYLAIYPDANYNTDGYINSATYILQTSRHSLQLKKDMLLQLADKLVELYWCYKKILPISDRELTVLPNPTSIFANIVEYRQVFDIMVQWYNFGSYDMSEEKFLLPLLVNNQVYEYYVLLKLAEMVEANGYRLDEQKCRRYSYTLGRETYNDVDHDNTFVFSKLDGGIITLYFQPVIWGNKYSESNNNGICLRRSTSLSIHNNGLDNIRGKNVSNAYYTPDYIIKFKKGNAEKYIIADAKLSSYNTVMSIQVENLAYKYQFSIQPTTPNAKILGVLILYGKSVLQPCKVESVHDIYHSPNFPDFWLTSLTESDKSTPESQIRALSEIINKLASED